MCNPKPRHSRSNLEGRCISFLKFRLSHGRQDAETHDTTQARRRGAARFASTRVSCGMNRPTSWRIAAMVAHKAATRRRIAWVAVTIAGGRPLPRNFQCCSPRSSNSVEIAAPTCALYSPSSKSRSNPTRSSHRRNPVLDANLQSPSIVSASKLDSLLYAGTHSGRQMHQYVRLSPDGDIKVTIH